MFVQIVKFILQLFLPHNFLLRRIESLDGIVLTFDDGPHPVHTPIILRELRTRNIKAIFFVTGKELYKYPELGKMIIQQGHLLGNHTFDHLNVGECSVLEYRQSIEKAALLLDNIVQGEHRKIFRPPYSAFSMDLLLYIYMSDYLLCNWTIDSRDSFIRNDDELSEYVRRLKIYKGDILLFHEDYRHTVDALPIILDDLQGRGYQFRLPLIG